MNRRRSSPRRLARKTARMARIVRQSQEPRPQGTWPAGRTFTSAGAARRERDRREPV